MPSIPGLLPALHCDCHPLCPLTHLSNLANRHFRPVVQGHRRRDWSNLLIPWPSSHHNSLPYADDEPHPSSDSPTKSHDQPHSGYSVRVAAHFRSATAPHTHQRSWASYTAHRRPPQIASNTALNSRPRHLGRLQSQPFARYHAHDSAHASDSLRHHEAQRA